MIFWPLNWLLPGQRTAWAFFPLWLGYALAVDALVYWRKGTSHLARNWRRYVGLFLVSAPSWWLFEALNSRVQNWNYLGTAGYSGLSYFLLASINFSTVIPAVFGAAELASSFAFIRRMKPWIKLRTNIGTILPFFIAGWVMLALMLVWPHYFFPFLWISVYFILEPVNVWLKNRSLVDWLSRGDWRPVVSLWVGVLITAFFWEMWNYYSYPQWVYSVPGVSFLHVFEMPLLGYGGYLPFALELFALYHLVVGLFGQKDTDYVQLHD